MSEITDQNIRDKWKEICTATRTKNDVIDSGSFAINLVRWFEKSLTDKIERLNSAASAILDCPYQIDEATVPKAGIDSAPEQVVGTMSVSLVKRRALQTALKGK